MVSAANLCLICKGARALCGNKICPLLARIKIKPIIEKKVSTEFFGPSTSVFVGHQGWPNVFVGPLVPIETKDLQILDQPSKWFGMNYSKIIELRSLILRSKYKQNIKSKTHFIEENRLLALSKKPTNIELFFKKKPVYEINFSDIVQPMGPSAQLEKLRITENIKIDRKVEYIISDELKANEQCLKLYESDIDIYKIVNIFSSGALGLEKRLVPTRWSFTATFDIVSKKQIENIKQYKHIEKITVLESDFLNNHFIILLLPGTWEFENFETWAPGSFWAQNLKKPEITEEYESYKGRTRYALTQGGGYYSSRLGCTIGLENMRRQARTIVFREINEGYILPVGSWQILENIKNAFRQKIMNFGNLNEALKFVGSKLKIPVNEYVKKSKILTQRRVFDFF